MPARLVFQLMVYTLVSKEKLDFGWIVSEVPASVVGVYTTNKVIAAPLIVAKNSVTKSKKMKAVVVNSGVANSCTGIQGMNDAYTMQKWTADKLGVDPDCRHCLYWCYWGIVSDGNP